MSSRLTRIAPWQAGKLFAVMYLLVGAIIAVPLMLVVLMSPATAEAEGFTAGLVLVFPVLYAVAALIIVPIACLLYNLSARLVGGLEVDLESGS